MPVPERPPMEITARVPGKCQCCNMPYLAGARLRQEHHANRVVWVLIDHEMREQPRAQRKDRTGNWPTGRRNAAGA